MEEDEINEHGRFWRVEEAIGDGRMTPANAIGGTLKIDANGKITLRRDPTLVPDSDIPEPWPEDSIVLGYLPHSDKFVRLEPLLGTYRFCLIGDSPLADRFSIDNCVNIEVPLDGFDDWLRLTSPAPKQSEDGGFILKSGAPIKWSYDLPTIASTLSFAILGS